MQSCGDQRIHSKIYPQITSINHIECQKHLDLSIWKCNTIANSWRKDCICISRFTSL